MFETKLGTLCRAIGFVGCMSVAWTAGAQDPVVGSLAQVSGISPFGPLSACGNFPGTPAGAIYLDSEIEPWIDVNPTNSSNIVGVWQQDRWTNGGSRGLVAGVSMDGGASWQKVVVPGITQCSGGAYQRASDPWLSFAPDGVLHQISLALDIDTPPGASGGFGRNAIMVSKSTDGGLSWSAPIVLAQDDKPKFLNDKESLTADATDARYVYAVWDRLQSPQGAVINPENVIGFGFKGPAYFARSIDGGNSWEPSRIIYDPAANNQTIGNQIVVLPNGTLLDFFNEIHSFRNDDGGEHSDFSLAYKYSTDKGATWLPHGPAIRTNKMGGIGTSTPDLGEPVRDAAILFDVAVDPNNGRLYAVWQDARFNGFDEIAFSMSVDDGHTWSEPIRINQTPLNANSKRRQAFVPSVAVVPDNGTIVVSYYDFRNDDASGELVDHWAVHCHDDCTLASNWSDGEARLTNSSFDLTLAPFARGRFLGDYAGLAAHGNKAFSLFIQPHGSDPASAFFRSLELDP